MRLVVRQAALRQRIAGSLLLAILAALASMSHGVAREASSFRAWAPTPPMGWDSWDSFATTINESQTRAQADYMAEHLKVFGWQYIIVDIQWYEPGAVGQTYRSGAVLTMDGHGRLMPAPNRFPSSADGSGFTTLARYVHAKGLKFGVHVMRGIPRQAVDNNLPIEGTTVRAREIADTTATCPWNADMYGVDMSKPGAQEYYNSVFALFASWGVDYVKVDDIARPYHRAEIEAVRQAIDRTGRPMVLSLSPGETPIDVAEHVSRHANLWRIGDDFWDTWPTLHEQFARLAQWSAHKDLGGWPDADMLPFGVLELGTRQTRFTPDEQYTVMTLWSIARSPLIHGGDMTQMDPFTLALLTNPEVLSVNQSSRDNRLLFDHDGFVAWMASVPDSTAKYLAVFNTRDQVDQTADRAIYRSEVVSRLRQGAPEQLDVDIRGASRLVLVIDGAGDGTSNDHGVWAEPTLIDSDGRPQRLTDRPWLRAAGGWGQVSTTKAPGGGAISVGGSPVPFGIAAQAESVVEYQVPVGTTRFRARIALDDGALKQQGGGSVRFLVFTAPPGGNLDRAGLPVQITFGNLGLPADIRVRDVWTREDLGTMHDTFAPIVNWHGARLFRLTPS